MKIIWQGLTNYKRALTMDLVLLKTGPHAEDEATRSQFKARSGQFVMDDETKKLADFYRKSFQREPTYP